nr:MAG TPA: hypothetical protein [Bacteriophage sp.]
MCEGDAIASPRERQWIPVETGVSATRGLWCA